MAFSYSLQLYMFSLLLFVVNNDYFVSNSVYHNIYTRRKNDLHHITELIPLYPRMSFYPAEIHTPL